MGTAAAERGQIPVMQSAKPVRGPYRPESGAERAHPGETGLNVLYCTPKMPAAAAGPRRVAGRAARSTGVG
jgi:hypothetical protein